MFFINIISKRGVVIYAVIEGSFEVHLAFKANKRSEQKL